MNHTGSNDAGLMLTKCSELWMDCFSELNLTGSGVLRGATTLVLTWMTRGKDNKEIKRGGSRVCERLRDRQSIIRVKMLTPDCTFTFHQVFAAAHGLKECTGGRPNDSPNARLPSASFFFLCPSLGQSHASTRPPQSGACVCAPTPATWLPLCRLNREQRRLFPLCRRKSETKWKFQQSKWFLLWCRHRGDRGERLCWSCAGMTDSFARLCPSGPFTALWL